MPPRVLLITGRPGVGKTTIITTLASALRRDPRLRGGFVTTELRHVAGSSSARSPRVGFEIASLDGKNVQILAHVEQHMARTTTLLPPRPAPVVGKYYVNVDAVDSVATSFLRGVLTTTTDTTICPSDGEEATTPLLPRIVLLDEIGKMELKSKAFEQTLMELFEGDLNSNCNNNNIVVVATIMQKHGEPVCDYVKAQPWATLWEVTEANRNQMVDRVLAWID
eukprot:PhM_4_TR9098/c0_g1_i1/m.36819/K06928/NTPCR; nucleoside-triphosphatase